MAERSGYEKGSEYGGNSGIIQPRKPASYRSEAFGNPTVQADGHAPEGGAALSAKEQRMVAARAMHLEANGIGTDTGGRRLSDDYVPTTLEEAEQDLRGENGRDNYNNMH